MKHLNSLLLFLSISMSLFAHKVDTLATNNSKVIVHFLGHGTLMLEYNNKIIHIDPWSRIANHDSLPKADAILITHHHLDHLDSIALSKVYTDKTELYWTLICANSSKFKAKGAVISNGDSFNTMNISVKAVPAYNIVNKRESGEPYHIKGEGNGYILNIDGLLVYVAGDTENIPEMAEFGKIDIAFLPMNLPFTMNPEMLKDAVLTLKPKILYPYHYGNTNTNIIVELLKNSNTEVRIR
jgi:L-ascorbate metabolism protein UlaG (beta-lactamase superfamily)